MTGTEILYRGTLADLRRTRDAWRKLGDAATALDRLPSHRAEASALAAQALELGAADFYVRIPCMFCRRQFWEPIRIGDPGRGEPWSCICDDCNTGIEDAIVAEHPDYERLADAIRRRREARGER